MIPLRKPRALRVGVSALFDPDDTPHARTFLRALAVARNCIAGLDRVEWCFLDDGANACRGAEVARQMIAREVDLVVGHFSSDAAVSAAALYRQAGIALLTPAATIDCLTLEHHNAFRFCPSDRQLARDLLAWLQTRQWQAVHIEADDSAHGQALARAIADAARQAGVRQVSTPGQAQVEVFAGRLQASREHWLARREAGSTRPLVLTDDAASPHLGHAQALDRDTYVIGFGIAGPARESGAAPCSATTLHQLLFGALPETYYRESLLMFYVLAVLANGAARKSELLEVLNSTTFSTPLGLVSFDQGECRGTFNSIWKLGEGGLVPVIE
ncbi:Extracellular ligand-binding receptor [Pseudomonas cichorii]|uniref:Extracellular ligand-binding receptor n=1 Tax=Pseudomonas cichorii TaxID=36746 RepID=A0A3M4M221_PSECI|nr:ABC transporter substrate-binding protein [Pseudomonas cichorii]RMQ47816.1 Extracellular ligand-binding receptor [Pseudomonas cichorii]